MDDAFQPDLFNPPPGFTIRKPASVVKERAAIRAFLEKEIRLPEQPRPAAPVKRPAPVRAEPVTPEEVSRFREAVEAQRRAALTAPEPLPPPAAPPNAATRARLAEYHQFKNAVHSTVSH